MIDVFNKEIKPGDMLVYLPGTDTINKMSYGIYTPYNTLMVWNTYMYNHIQMLEQNELKSDAITESDASKYSGYYKVQNMSEQEARLYEKFVQIYKDRVKGIVTYEEEKRSILPGSIVISRFDNMPYLYLGRMKNCYGYRVVEGKVKKDGIDIRPLYDASKYQTSPCYTYIELLSFLRSNGYNFDSLLTPKIAKELFRPSYANNVTVAGRKIGPRILDRYSFSITKQPKSNLYYFGQMDISQYIDKNTNTLTQLINSQGELMMLVFEFHVSRRKK